jgi:hypothetical protein
MSSDNSNEARATINLIDFLPLENETFGQGSQDKLFLQQQSMIDSCSYPTSDVCARGPDTIKSKLIDEICAAAITLIQTNPENTN